MEVLEKLKILADSAKYDVSCSSSGSKRKNMPGGLGNAENAGICHSWGADGRCISLLKILMTNFCIYDCKYCINRCSNDIKRAYLTPEEIADITINFYKRNYIEGLFLSSGIIKTPNYTMERMYEAIYLIRKKYNFNGYIHTKTIPGADEEIIQKMGLLVDRMSVNIELPSSDSLKLLAPQKEKDNIVKPMKYISNTIMQNNMEKSKYFKSFVPAGQSTQLIVGASPETDFNILSLTENLYQKYRLKRVYYSAYISINNDKNLPQLNQPPLLRENRLYQADWLLRFYGFNAKELLNEESPNFNHLLDPKADWALRNLDKFPVEVNKADYYTLLRIPGIGVLSAKKIVSTRRYVKLDFDNLKKLGIVMKRAQYFITCNGKYLYNLSAFNQSFITNNLIYEDRKLITKSDRFEQISIFNNNILPTMEDKLKCLTGQI